MTTPVTFELAKLLKEKLFNNETEHFYTKPNSKMFGIDEHGRYYPIKNISKKLYRCGEHAALNSESVYSAPTIAEVVVWLYKKHGIYIHISPHGEEEDLFVDCKWWFSIYKDKLFNLIGGSKVTEGIEDFDSPTETYEAAIEYTLNNLA